MTTFSLSNAPSSTLFPGLSPQQDPNYNNAFQVDFSSLRNNTSPIPDYAKQFAINSQNLVNRMKADIGLTFASQGSPSTQFLGKEMLQQSIDNKPTFVNPTENKAKFSNKFMNSTFGKNSTQWNNAYDIANSIVTGIFGEKDEYSGSKGHITRTMDNIYDNIKDTANNFGPIGMAVSQVMGASEALGNLVNGLGGGTDGMSTTDAVLGSAFLQLTPFGLINGFGGKKADTITKNDEVFETIGSSYTGTNQTVNDALTKSGKKYGLFSGKARRNANNLIQEAKRQQEVMEDISDEATDRFAIRNSMAAINGNRRAYILQGGYDQSNVRVGRNGMNIELLNRARKVVKQSQKLQTGGVISDPFEVYLQSLPQAQRDSTNFRVKDYWEYNGRPKNFDEARKKGMFEWKEDFDQNGNSIGWSWHAFTVAKNPNSDEYDFMKSSSHPTVQKEIDWYNSDKPDAVEFRNNYELQRTEPYWKYVRRKKDTISHKEGGQIQVKPTEIILIEPELIEPGIDAFKEGGSINVIPDGSLHARKHNMDIEGITPKGIPVIDNDGEQQAEIEREELIIRLEVTKQLEELEKKFYDNETSQKEKDECALEAGKLLVEEILYNTQDNTNSLL